MRGQYRGYRDTDGVDPASTVETYAAIRLRVDTWRWSDVPIIVRAGKCLPVKATEIIVELKRPPEKLFPTQHPHGNRLRFQIEPEVVIGLEVQSRKPGVEKFAVQDIELTAIRHAARNIPPYQRLLSAALRGEHDLFASQETIEEAWRIVDPILGNATPIHEYERGSWGPAEADRLAPAPGWYAPRVSGQVVTHPSAGEQREPAEWFHPRPRQPHATRRGSPLVDNLHAYRVIALASKRYRHHRSRSPRTGGPGRARLSQSFCDTALSGGGHPTASTTCPLRNATGHGFAPAPDACSRATARVSALAGLVIALSPKRSQAKLDDASAEAIVCSGYRGRIKGRVSALQDAVDCA